jgi:hypothetical protein
MRPVKLALIAFVALVFGGGCAVAPKIVLERADRKARDNDLHGALVLYDGVAARKDSKPPEKLQALLDAADVCDRLEDFGGARSRLERAVTVEAPGLTEKAMFYLAEHVQKSDRPRALNLYYRAAAIAERHGGGFPYKIAMDRIMQFSVSSP